MFANGLAMGTEKAASQAHPTLRFESRLTKKRIQATEGTQRGDEVFHPCSKYPTEKRVYGEVSSSVKSMTSGLAAEGRPVRLQLPRSVVTCDEMDCCVLCPAT